MKLTARTRGILLMILSAGSFSLMSIAVKLTGGTIPVFEQVFFRNIVIIVVAGCYLLRHKLPLFGRGNIRWRCLAVPYSALWAWF